MFCWEPKGCYCHRLLYSDSTLLVLNWTSFNSINALLALNWRNKETREESVRLTLACGQLDCPVPTSEPAPRPGHRPCWAAWEPRHRPDVPAGTPRTTSGRSGPQSVVTSPSVVDLEKVTWEGNFKYSHFCTRQIHWDWRNTCSFDSRKTLDSWGLKTIENKGGGGGKGLVL